MPFTNQDLQNQSREIQQIAEELSRLNNEFEAQKKALGLPAGEPVTIDPQDVTPELEKAMEEATARARRAGEERTASIRATASPSSPSRSRRGAMRI